tara:strand:- start:339 stop:2888 length:2550 start_codon:yes stop_codon:yes gene_type:complete
MAIQKTIFGAKAPFKKQKFDGTLKLQQMPDTSAQAAQAAKQEVQALEAQYTLDRAVAKLENDQALTVQKGKDLGDTFLSKLAPFSPALNAMIEQGQEAFENFRTQQAKDEAGRQVRLAEIDGGIEAMEENFSRPIIKSLENNPEASANLVSNLFSYDLGMKRRVASAKADLLAKKYKSGFADFQNSGFKINVPDATSPNGVRELDVGSVTRPEEVNAVLRAYDIQMERLFKNDPPEIVQEFRDTVREDRVKLKNQLTKNVNAIQSSHVEAQAIMAFRGGADFALTLDRLAQNNKANGDPGKAGYPKALEIMTKHIKQGITAGDYTLTNLLEWGSQSAGKGLPSNAEYRSTMFTELKNHLNATNEKFVTQSNSTAKQNIKIIEQQFARQVFVEGQIPDKATIQQFRDKIKLEDPTHTSKLLDEIENGRSVESLTRDALQDHFDNVIIRQGLYIPEGTLQARLINFEGLYDRYREANARNGKLFKDPNVKQKNDELKAFLFSNAATPGGPAGQINGGDLKYDVNGKAASVAAIRVPALVQKDYERRLGLRMANGEELTQDVLLQEFEATKAWFRSERNNPQSQLYYQQGNYVNINRYATVNPDGKSVLLSTAEIEKLSVQSGERLRNFQQQAIAKYGANGTAYARAFKDAELLQGLITVQEAEEAYELAFAGKPLPQRFKYLTQWVTGGNPLQLARTAVKTLTGKDLVFNNMLDNPIMQETFDEDQANRAIAAKMQNTTGAAQRRAAQQLQSITPRFNTTPQTTQQAAQDGSATGQQGSMAESMGNVEGIQGNENTITPGSPAEAENQSLARLQQLIQDLRRQYNGDEQKARAEAQRQWRIITNNPNFTIE